MYDRVKEDNQTLRWGEVRDGLAAAVRTDKATAVRAAAAATLGRLEGDAAKAVPDLNAAAKDSATGGGGRGGGQVLRRIAVDKDAAKDVAAALTGTGTVGEGQERRPSRPGVGGPGDWASGRGSL